MLIRACVTPCSCKWGSRLACSSSASIRRTPENLTRRTQPKFLRMMESGGLAGGWSAFPNRSPPEEAWLR